MYAINHCCTLEIYISIVKQYTWKTMVDTEVLRIHRDGGGYYSQTRRSYRRWCAKIVRAVIYISVRGFWYATEINMLVSHCATCSFQQEASPWAFRGSDTSRPCDSPLRDCWCAGTFAVRTFYMGTIASTGVWGGAHLLVLCCIVIGHPISPTVAARAQQFFVQGLTVVLMKGEAWREANKWMSVDIDK